MSIPPGDAYMVYKPKRRRFYLVQFRFRGGRISTLTGGSQSKTTSASGCVLMKGEGEVWSELAEGRMEAFIFTVILGNSIWTLTA